MAKKKKNVNVAPVAPEVAPVPVLVEEPKVEFGVWFVMREKRIPPQHMREILWADFKARGLSLKETVAAYDAALAAYGVKL